VLDAVVLRAAAGGLGVVSAAHLPKKQSWYTELPGGKGAVVAVDLGTDRGDVALEVAYRVLRASVVADARRSQLGSGPTGDGAPAALDADALLAKTRAVLATCDRLRRMKKNCTDTETMVKRGWGWGEGHALCVLSLPSRAAHAPDGCAS
jgi:hypothetical protein